MNEPTPRADRNSPASSTTNPAGDRGDLSQTSTPDDAPMTSVQAAYLKTLCEEHGEPYPADLSQGEATRRIATLQAKTGRVPQQLLLDDQSDG
jgi:hypothetical protein